ncbi:23S rRNA (adenine(2503)-C(2))-methyltransferase RlmN [archaeon]|nr:MAG: 23S rRNA (adenine(2503)-C(2))-methyltransferase RlmN [archaeon]
MPRRSGTTCSPRFQAAPSMHTDHVLTMPFDQLATELGGTGKARIVWNHLRHGRNPLLSVQSTGNVTNHSKDHELLSDKAQQRLKYLLGEGDLIPNTLVGESLATDGTRKLLLRLSDNQEIESVLIPSVKHDRTTICISTQVGCDRGCAFCLTATMGFVRNLTATEMAAQVIRGIELATQRNMPVVSNVVFMGMGDSGRNIQEVGQAVACMTDGNRLSVAKSKVTVSTVGPSPQIFTDIAQMNCTIAWSLHSCDEQIRRRLVPSSKYTLAELRNGLVAALRARSSMRMRTIMIALTLIENINDKPEDALLLAEFLRPVLKATSKIAIDLIPYNDISVVGFSQPTRERINAFQQVLRDQGYFCTVRVTRGDDESAACGMLATKSTKKRVAANRSSHIAC